jgi:pimeloyl-ACP methyl ester carboxylesterase
MSDGPGALWDTRIPEHIEHRVRARDGRTLAVAEWGDPSGVPLFALHGTPGGRVSFWKDPTIYARHGLRRLTLDRPGYGESTRLPGRIVADVVPDIIAIADELGIGSFAVTGGSGGGPHALACAALLPDRILRCLADVSIAPLGAEGLDWLAGQAKGNVEEFEAAQRGEPDIRRLTEVEAAAMLARFDAGDANFLGEDYEMPEADRAQMLKHAGRMAVNLRAGLGSGVDGWVDDDIAFTKPWGFDVADIRVPVLLSYGRHDTLVPAAHGDWLAAHIPQAVSRVHENTGHLGDDDDIERDMAWLAGRS